MAEGACFRIPQTRRRLPRLNSSSTSVLYTILFMIPATFAHAQEAVRPFRGITVEQANAEAAHCAEVNARLSPAAKTMHMQCYPHQPSQNAPGAREWYEAQRAEKLKQDLENLPKAQATMYGTQMFIARHCSGVEPDMDVIESLEPVPGRPVAVDPSKMTTEQEAAGQPTLKSIEDNPLGNIYKVGSSKDIEAKCGLFSAGLTSGQPALYKWRRSSDADVQCPAGEHLAVTSGGSFCVDNRYD